VGSFKNLLLQNHKTNFNQNLHKLSLGQGDSNLLKDRPILIILGGRGFRKGRAPLQGEIIAKE
jgi:hypothetical protein